MSYVVSAIEWFFLAYFVLFNAGYISLNLMALPTLRRKIALRPVEDLPAVYSGLEPPVSLLVPVRNAQAGIEASVRSLLQLDYPQYEVVVIDDGSDDGTLATLQRAFELEAFPEAMWRRLPSKEVRAVFQSSTHPNLRVACQRALNSHIDTLTRDVVLAKELYAPDAAWTAESVGTFIQAVLQGSFIFAKAHQGPEVAHANIEHLRRYLDLLFPRAPKEQDRRAA